MTRSLRNAGNCCDIDYWHYPLTLCFLPVRNFFGPKKRGRFSPRGSGAGAGFGDDVRGYVPKCGCYTRDAGMVSTRSGGKRAAAQTTTGGPPAKKARQQKKQQQATLDGSGTVTTKGETANDHQLEDRPPNNNEAAEAPTEVKPEEPAANAQQNKPEDEVMDLHVADRDRETNGGAEAGQNQQQAHEVQVDEAQVKQDKKSDILEKGLIYFFFRPRVGVDSVDSLADVQRSYILLHVLPEGGKLSTDAPYRADSQDLRTIIVPKKKLPSTGDRFIGIVSKGDGKVGEVSNDLGQSTYETATRGQRVTQSARPFVRPQFLY